MKKINYFLTVAVACVLVSCGGGKKPSENKATEAPKVPEYTVLENPQVDLSEFTKDDAGYYLIFDGVSAKGWRGYGKESLPGKWSVEDGTLKFSGTGTGESQELDGGDIIFAHKFKDFELSVDWKISEGGNSGIFYLAQEVQTKKEDGTPNLEPIYISAPESQVLDNERHPDAKLGVDGNRQSSSLYDMIPAKPQNAKPAGEWNNTTIMVYQGTVVHWQNGEKVLEYHLWTPQWTELLQASKFSEKKWPLAFELLNNYGRNKAGYIGMQDHGNDVWFKNIKVKLLQN
jgi:hypothetical protein